MAVVQQPVQDRRGDDRVAEKLAPLAEALVGREDNVPRSYLAETSVKKSVTASPS